MSARSPMIAILLLLAPIALAQEDAGLESRAERLAELRAEVAELGDELAARRDEADARLRALQAQEVDLEVQVGREELRLQQLGDLITAKREAAVEDADLETAVKPIVLDGITAATELVKQGLPYRTDERLAALDELQRGVEGGELVPSRALGRLWAFIEDERRLARENALDRQTLSLGGREVLAEVARLGTVAMFYRTPDGEIGFAERSAAGWTWVPVTDRARIEQVTLLFDSLQKGIRIGWFELPWAFGDKP